MKLSKFESGAIIIALLLICFGGGYFAGRGHKSHDISISPLISVTEDVPRAESAPIKRNESETVFTRPVNINTADKDALCSLDGIGEVLAERILEYRSENGTFSSKEELVNVYGIGDKIYEEIKDEITV